MAALRAPAPMPVPTSTLAQRRSVHMPLSSHGMPKTPRALSPERPHRFSAIVLPNSPDSSPMTPLSPGPMSPPMSAKSFGTFIDSAPSTPAYSPRQADGEWSNSQITILRPVSSSSLPSSPTEPLWEMMTPLKQPAKAVHSKEDHTVTRPKHSASTTTPLALSKPTKKAKTVAAKKGPVTDVPEVSYTASEEDALRKEAEEQARKLVKKEQRAAKSQDADDKSQPLPSPKSDTAPLGKLATRMKSLLRRNTSEKKKEKRCKPQQEYDRLDDTHWSEM